MRRFRYRSDIEGLGEFLEWIHHPDIKAVAPSVHCRGLDMFGAKRPYELPNSVGFGAKGAVTGPLLIAA